MRKKSPSKLKWRVGEKPTGWYQAFQKRSWPSAEYLDEKMAVMLYDQAGQSYEPRIAESCTIEIRVADYRGNGFHWMTLKYRAAGLKQAKAVAQKFVDQHYKTLRDPDISIIDVQRVK